jgi:hypothetical protein
LEKPHGFQQGSEVVMALKSRYVQDYRRIVRQIECRATALSVLGPEPLYIRARSDVYPQLCAELWPCLRENLSRALILQENEIRTLERFSENRGSRMFESVDLQNLELIERRERPVDPVAGAESEIQYLR